MKKPRSKKRPPAARSSVRISHDLAIRALDISEQLLEAVRESLNGGAGMPIDDLISFVQDHTIVSARIRLAQALPKDARLEHLEVKR